jgi:hypothetical protein
MLGAVVNPPVGWPVPNRHPVTERGTRRRLPDASDHAVGEACVEPDRVICSDDRLRLRRYAARAADPLPGAERGARVIVVLE